MKKFKIAFSPCPNDTFIFHALINERIDTHGYKFQTYIKDVEELNNLAFREEYDITKLSFHAYLHLKDKYTLLNSGSALGFGCGPLLITGNSEKNLREMKIAIPGKYTTASMLLQLWNPEITNIETVRFDEIIPGICDKRFDAGLIIHESRFIYKQYGLEKIIDLGEWWEKETGLPIPLGCIVIKNSIAEKGINADIDNMIKNSILYAHDYPFASREYIKSFSQELDDSVIDQHIELYVNEYTVDTGEIGKKAINKLEEMASARGVI